MYCRTAPRAASALLLAALVTGATYLPLDAHQATASTPVVAQDSVSVSAPSHDEIYFQIQREAARKAEEIRLTVLAARQAEIESRERHLEEVSRGNLPDLVTRRVDTRSYVTAEHLESALTGTGLAGLGAFFVEAEETYGINAIFLCAIAALESAWGSSEYALERHNLFGYGAYTHNPDAAVVFEGKRASIMAAARLLREEYVDNPSRQAATLETIGVIWADDDWSDGDPSWAWKVADTASTIATRIQERTHHEQ